MIPAFLPSPHPCSPSPSPTSLSLSLFHGSNVSTIYPEAPVSSEQPEQVSFRVKASQSWAWLVAEDERELFILLSSCHTRVCMGVCTHPPAAHGGVCVGGCSRREEGVRSLPGHKTPEALCGLLHKYWDLNQSCQGVPLGGAILMAPLLLAHINYVGQWVS